MLRYAWKSIWRDRLRFAITVGGVAMAVLLMLVMNGLFDAAGRQIKAYIDFSDADLFVAQGGVRNMHMATSVLPPPLLEQVRAVPGVAAAEGIAYFATSLERDGEADTVYAIGLDPNATMGGPWRMKAGGARPGPGEAVIPDRQWGKETPALDGRVTVSGRELRVSGIALETKILAASLVFLNHEDAAVLRGNGHMNYFLVRVADGRQVDDVAAAIRAQVPGVTVMTRQELSANDLDVAIQMGVDVLKIMAAVGFLIGLAVIALTVYVATVEQLRQYGVLKAIGAGPGHLFVAVLGQAMAASALGYVAGVGLTVLVGWVAPRISAGLEVDLSPLYAATVFGYVVLMGLLAAIAPYLRIQRVDPVDIFRT